MQEDRCTNERRNRRTKAARVIRAKSGALLKFPGTICRTSGYNKPLRFDHRNLVPIKSCNMRLLPPPIINHEHAAYRQRDCVHQTKAAEDTMSPAATAYFGDSGLQKPLSIRHSELFPAVALECRVAGEGTCQLAAQSARRRGSGRFVHLSRAHRLGRHPCRAF